MHHAVDVEIQQVVEKFGIDELQPGHQTGEHLRHKQHHRHAEILDRKLLAGIQIGIVKGRHGQSPSWRIGVKLAGKPLVSMAAVHFRKAITPLASSSVRP